LLWWGKLRDLSWGTWKNVTSRRGKIWEQKIARKRGKGPKHQKGRGTRLPAEATSKGGATRGERFGYIKGKNISWDDLNETGRLRRPWWLIYPTVWGRNLQRRGRSFEGKNMSRGPAPIQRKRNRLDSGQQKGRGGFKVLSNDEGRKKREVYKEKEKIVWGPAGEVDGRMKQIPREGEGEEKPLN